MGQKRAAAEETHLFTGATLVGKPSISTETGEVSGVSIQTDQYIRLGV